MDVLIEITKEFVFDLLTSVDGLLCKRELSLWLSRLTDDSTVILVLGQLPYASVVTSED